MREIKSIVKAIRMTSKIYECLKQEADEEGKTTSKMLNSILEQRYKNLNVGRNANKSEEEETTEETLDDRICYPIDNIPGKPLKAANKVWLKGEIVTYGDLVHRIYKQHKVRIAKADLRGVPLDQIIKEIEGE